MAQTAKGPEAAIRVRAIRLGYYDHIRRREGNVFTLHEAKHFSDRWMVKVHSREKETFTTAQQAINLHHDELVSGRMPGQRLNDEDTI